MTASAHGAAGIERMSFCDVDEEELDLVTVLRVQFLQPTG